MRTFEHTISDAEKVVNLKEKVKNVEISRLTAPGENYMSLILRVDFKTEENGHCKTVSTVAKRLPLSRKKDGFDIHAHMMKNEIKWYSEIVPVLKSFAEEREIKLDFYPEYLGSRYSLDSSKEEADGDSVLFLENIIPKGFRNEDRYVGFDLITSKVILKNLALFHALPIAIKETKPDLFPILKAYLDKSLPQPPSNNQTTNSDVQDEPSPSEAKNPTELLLDELTNIPDIAPYMPKIKPLFDKTAADVRKLTKEPWNTTTHNDFWINNIMVNYTKGKIPLVKILDYQMCFYLPYAKDVVFFLLTSVRNDVIKESMDDLLRFYFDEFTSTLRRLNFNTELTYKEYLEEIRTAAAESELGHAMFFSTMIFGEKGTGKDVTVEGFDPLEHLTSTLKNMSQDHKNKLSLIVSEAIKRSWL